MLRGRGGCYKHTFYGISSYQCMESTPSLACANKCVFCWRHHKNPVGREWRWKVDPPEEIVAAAIARHVAMVREFGGTPGVVQARWEAALVPRQVVCVRGSGEKLVEVPAERVRPKRRESGAT